MIAAKMKYQIVYGVDISALEELVNQMLEEGFELHGFPFSGKRLLRDVTLQVICQAMIKRKNPKK